MREAFSQRGLLVVGVLAGMLLTVAAVLLLTQDSGNDSKAKPQGTAASGTKCSLRSGEEKKLRASCPYAAAVLKDAPLSYWRLSEGGNRAVDLAGSTMTTYQGGVTQRVSSLTPGEADLAASFDADDDYVVATGSGQLTFFGDFTVEAWFEAESLQNAFVACKHDEAYYVWLADDGTIETGYKEQGTWDYVTARGGSYSPGEVVHVVGTRKGDAIKLYANGSEVASGSGSLAQEVDFSDFYIGTCAHDRLPIGEDDAWPDGLFFDGTIDDVAVYDYALNPRQIARHYDVGQDS